MPPRAMWTGQLRLSLVSFGVRLFAATESSKRVAMNQLHRDCHQRLRNQTVCPVHGPVSRDEIVKGYEYEKDSYVIIAQEDLDAIRLESTKTIDLVEFVDPDSIDPLYVNSPYFLGPDGPVAGEAFSVIHGAMKRLKKVGIGKVVLHGREHVVALTPMGKGFLLTTLRYAAEVRSADELFEEVRSSKAEKEQVDLAETIIKSKTAKFEPKKYTDRYQEAFFDIVKAKVEGEEPVVLEEDATPRTYNFMEALRESVQQAEGGKRAGKKDAARPAKTKKKTKKTAPKKPAARSVSGSRSKKKSRKGA